MNTVIEINLSVSFVFQFYLIQKHTNIQKKRTHSHVTDRNTKAHRSMDMK